MDFEYEHGIFGSCFGIILSRRGTNAGEYHVVWNLVVEDDETWHIHKGSAGSSFWLPELQRLTTDALVWLEAHCDKDPSGFGYVFRTP